jgi:hypothetical protein
MQTSEMVMEMGLEMCVITVPASPTRTRLTLTMILWEMHVTATLTGMGELVNKWREDLGREVKVNVKESHEDIQESCIIVLHTHS